jgi:hypothetical protein
MGSIWPKIVRTTRGSELPRDHCISVYRYLRYTTTSCGEHTVVLFWGFTI